MEAPPAMGTLFEAGPSGFKVLWTFQGPDGADPSGAPLAAADGTVTGSTAGGGVNGGGTFYTFSNGVLTTIYPFSASATDPAPYFPGPPFPGPERSFVWGQPLLWLCAMPRAGRRHRLQRQLRIGVQRHALREALCCLVLSCIGNACRGSARAQLMPLPDSQRRQRPGQWSGGVVLSAAE